MNTQQRNQLSLDIVLDMKDIFQFWRNRQIVFIVMFEYVFYLKWMPIVILKNQGTKKNSNELWFNDELYFAFICIK